MNEATPESALERLDRLFTETALDDGLYDADVVVGEIAEVLSPICWRCCAADATDLDLGLCDPCRDYLLAEKPVKEPTFMGVPLRGYRSEILMIDDPAPHMIPGTAGQFIVGVDGAISGYVEIDMEAVRESFEQLAEAVQGVFVAFVRAWDEAIGPLLVAFAEAAPQPEIASANYVRQSDNPVRPIRSVRHCPRHGEAMPDGMCRACGRAQSRQGRRR